MPLFDVVWLMGMAPLPALCKRASMDAIMNIKHHTKGDKRDRVSRIFGILGDERFPSFSLVSTCNGSIWSYWITYYRLMEDVGRVRREAV